MKNPSPFATRGRHGDRTVKRVKKQDRFGREEYGRDRSSRFEATALQAFAPRHGRNGSRSNAMQFDFERRGGNHSPIIEAKKNSPHPELVEGRGRVIL